MITLEQSPRAATRTGSHRRFWLVVALITGVQLLMRGWAAWGGWFYWDDFWWHDIVASNDLLPAAGLSLGGHFSPLTYIPYWLLTAAFPYEWLSRVVVMLITLLGINAGVLAVSRRLWPGRGPQLAVYVLWAFSTLAAPSWLWYSQFSMLGALLLTSTWTLWAYLRALASRDTGPSVLAVGMLLVSLFTQERNLTTAFLGVAFLLFVCVPSVPELAWRARRGLWLASAGSVGLWAIVYLSVTRDEPTPAGAVASVTNGFAMIRVSGIPALLGGPWVLNDEPVLPRAGTPMWVQVIAIAGLAALVAWSVRLNRRAWRPWVILALGLVVDGGLVIMARGGTLGQLAIGEWRYFSDLAVLAPLLMVSAFVPPGTRAQWTSMQLKVMAALLGAFTVSTLVTTLPLGRAWHESQSRPFIQNAVSQLELRGQVALMDRVVPPNVVNAVLGKQRLASKVLSILDLEAGYDVPTTHPLWLDDSGYLVPAELVGGRVSQGVGECPYEVRGVETTWVALAGPTDFFDWGVRIDYDSDSDVRAGVTDGPSTVVVDLPAGNHSMYVPMPGVGERVGVFLVEADKSICVAQIRSGKAGPA